MGRSGQKTQTAKPRRGFKLTAAQITEIEALRAEIRVEEGGSRDFHEAGGQCGIVSEAVAALLAEHGAQEYWGGAYVLSDDTICWDHCWATLPDGTIVDATADQFEEGDSVRVIAPRSPLQARYLQWQEIDNILSDLRARAVRVGAQQVLEELSHPDVRAGVFGETYEAEYRQLVSELES